jgi:N-acylneuraminate cytidylyltransferase
MWVLRGGLLLPLMPFIINGTPWHSNQYSNLPEVYVQNASLEIAKTKLVFDQNSIAGEVILPFITEGLEGFDINYENDFQAAENYILTEKNILPSIKQIPYQIFK